MLHWVMVAPCTGKSFMLKHIRRMRVGLPDLHTQKVGKKNPLMTKQNWDCWDRPSPYTLFPLWFSF